MLPSTLNCHRTLGKAAAFGRRNRQAVVTVKAFKTEAPASTKKMVKLRFVVQKETNYGEHIRVVGSSPFLGGWQVDAAPVLDWTDNHVWTVTVPVPSGTPIEFKLVQVFQQQPPLWENAPFTTNRMIEIGNTSTEVEVKCTWDAPEKLQLMPVGFDEEELNCQKGNLNLIEAIAMEPEMQSIPAVMHEQSAAVVELDKTEVALPDSVEDYNLVVGGGEKEAEEEMPGQKEVVEEKEEKPEKVTSTLQAIGKTAGYVAVGLAGAAAFSALAIDVTDVAIMSAVVAAASGAAMTGKKSSVEETSKMSSADPGVAIAAGVLSAFDVATEALKNINGHKDGQVIESADEDFIDGSAVAYNPGNEAEESHHEATPKGF